MNRQTIAWTGGSEPKTPGEAPIEEKRLSREIFREQVRMFSDYWGDAPNRDTLRIFYRRARYEAHATVREGVPA